MSTNPTTALNEEARDIARAWMAAQADRKRHEKAAEDAKNEAQALANDLERLLGVGGVVELPDMDMTFRVKDGDRRVNKDAILANMERLPERCKPREETVIKVPSVADLDAAADVLMARGLKVEDLVTRGDVKIEARMALD